MHKQLITPPEIKAKAQAVLALLDGLSFFEAGYVLDEAHTLFEQSKALLHERSVFSTELRNPMPVARGCVPTDLSITKVPDGSAVIELGSQVMKLSADEFQALHVLMAPLPLKEVN